MFTDNFTYGRIKSRKKVIYLYGSMVCPTSNGQDQEQVPIWFVLVESFPQIAPRVFIKNPQEKGGSKVKKGPFENEVNIQYMAKWQGFNAQYNL